MTVIWNGTSSFFSCVLSKTESQFYPHLETGLRHDSKGQRHIPFMIYRTISRILNLRNFIFLRARKRNDKKKAVFKMNDLVQYTKIAYTCLRISC